MRYIGFSLLSLYNNSPSFLLVAFLLITSHELFLQECALGIFKTCYTSMHTYSIPCHIYELKKIKMNLKLFNAKLSNVTFIHPNEIQWKNVTPPDEH